MALYRTLVTDTMRLLLGFLQIGDWQVVDLASIPRISCNFLTLASVRILPLP